MPTGTFASSTLLWLRRDLPRKRALAYWRGPHAELVARTPGFREYRQHHFEPANPGLWPELPGVGTAIPPARRIDGMPEATFDGALAVLRPQPRRQDIFAGEANVFERSLLHLTGPRGGRHHRDEDARAGFRTVVLLRRRDGVGARAFRGWVNNALGPALADAPGMAEVRTQVFLPWMRQLWETPDVAHDNPPAERFHASIVLGAADRPTLEAALAAPAVSATREGQRGHCAAVHAYAVAETYVFCRDGRPTLPEPEPVPDPQAQPVPGRPLRRSRAGLGILRVGPGIDWDRRPPDGPTKGRATREHRGRRDHSVDPSLPSDHGQHRTAGLLPPRGRIGELLPSAVGEVRPRRGRGVAPVPGQAGPAA